jgi:hypothetical protein
LKISINTIGYCTNKNVNEKIKPFLLKKITERMMHILAIDEKTPVNAEYATG